MRNEKIVDIIDLAQALAASAEGMTLDEMAQFSNVGRRTAERRRDAIAGAFGPLEEVLDGRQTRFRLTGRGIRNFAVAPTAEELAEVENIARQAEAGQDKIRAKILRSLLRKIKASFRQSEKLRLATDTEAQLRAEAFAHRVGPRPFANPEILIGLRKALLAGLIVKFYYQPEAGDPPKWRKVVPYGLLFGPRYYLVANVPSRSSPVLFRLDRMSNLEVTREPGNPPSSFDLATYALQSFGIFQEEAEDIILRFDAEVASEARSYIFYPNQTLKENKDGSLTVEFVSGGFLELAQHLMIWGNSVSIISPSRLKEIMWQEVQNLYDHYHLNPKRKSIRK